MTYKKGDRKDIMYLWSLQKRKSKWGTKQIK